MNKRVKKKWLKALRSGEYEQGRFRLLKRGDDQTPDKFCCLGVLCDLHARETGDGWDSVSYKAEDFHLPVEVSAWAGLPSRDPEINGLNVTDLNDGEANRKPKSFKQLANLIEKHL